MLSLIKTAKANWLILIPPKRLEMASFIRNRPRLCIIVRRSSFSQVKIMASRPIFGRWAAFLPKCGIENIFSQEQAKSTNFAKYSNSEVALRMKTGQQRRSALISWNFLNVKRRIWKVCFQPCPLRPSTWSTSCCSTTQAKGYQLKVPSNTHILTRSQEHACHLNYTFWKNENV